MPPPGGGGGEGGDGGDHGHKEPASTHGNGGRDEEDPSESSLSPPSSLPGLAVVPVESENKKRRHEQAQVFIPEGVLMEILSRVPYRSLCRFKCVSGPWLALCSDHGVRKRSPQTLSGFFHFNRGWRFHNYLSREKGPPMVDPGLRFLRGTFGHFEVLQCSTSLLLCRCWKAPHPKLLGWNSFPEGRAVERFRWGPEADQFDYVVCNPATRQWALLPPVPPIELHNQADGDLFRAIAGHYLLGFDPAVPSRFVVFVPVFGIGLPMTWIYSSETRGWTSIRCQLDDYVNNPRCFFLNGTILYFCNSLSIVTVNTEGNVWREMKLPPAMTNIYVGPSFGQSQGCLYAWRMDDCQLSVWALENYDGGQWTLRCTVDCLELFGRDCRKENEFYRMFAIHPECDMIFLIDRKEKTLSYDMNNKKVHAICASGDFPEGLPYTPCFEEWT
ncbi:hypothetical protein VPH35_011306 [Triticum aestivum]|uniref:uncharacterized protein n=1 Tax=Triticum aestivum TaxID=4565 RepID=UPI001D022A95|nr:uncharacterized protein LOC123098927 [Triticum aestivum]